MNISNALTYLTWYSEWCEIEEVITAVTEVKTMLNNLTEQLAKAQAENERYRITINAENDRLDRNDRLEAENAQLRRELAEFEHDERLAHINHDADAIRIADLEAELAEADRKHRMIVEALKRIESKLEVDRSDEACYECQEIAREALSE